MAGLAAPGRDRHGPTDNNPGPPPVPTAWRLTLTSRPPTGGRAGRAQITLCPLITLPAWSRRSAGPLLGFVATLEGPT